MLASLSLLGWPGGAPALSILIYHRVLPAPDPLRPGEIDAALFEAQVRFLARHFTLMTVSDAAKALREGRLPRRAACITFDDGYADNLTVAHPLLSRLGAPATLFVATGYLNGGRMFSDTVIEFVRKAQGPTLNLSGIGMGTHAISTAEERLMAITALQVQLKYLAPQERDAKVQQMLAAHPVGALPDDLMLTDDQLRQWAAAGHEVGGHTVDHTVLTTLTPDAAREQVQTGRACLERLTGVPVRSFAYPNGRPARDYDATHAAMLRELGFEAAVSTAAGVARPGADPFQLPRYTPWGRSITMFAARMMRNARMGGPAALV
ncbi:polysaccharide deacetylase family protein [Roseateles terrae]|uniref:Peptidoglycan/xylan/chitin deacetylase (PgdA/CDA1 family) n=1 Tax=Roseateles terrae TaxID=431060 RepID=A0ABR6GWY2_9BURK|nr:polysaccharide deacetylase family protein [Roseateles terrae]MBB3196616.1 peptidoglycan/xylan/chitin deacetylase (PgdA/CDA1 family) [Roseateles terrae]